MREIDRFGTSDATQFAQRRMLTYMCAAAVKTRSRCLEDHGRVEVGRGLQHPWFKFFNSTHETRGRLLPRSSS